MGNEKDLENLEWTEEPELGQTGVSEAETAALEGATVVVAGAEPELGSGVGEAVIDRDEWNKIVADVDAKQAEAAKKEKEMKENKKGKKKKKKQRFFLWFLLTLLVLGLIGGGVGAYWVKGIIDRTPEIDPSNIYDYLTENSVILDDKGEILTYVYEGSALRTNVEYQDIPEDMIWTLLCTEDKTFFEHHGFNFIRIMGAIWDTIKSGGKKRIGGTSTVTQQLARNIYLASIKSERSIERKIQEAYYTVIIERSMSKEQILEAYLNTIYLGFNAEGIQAAAQAYFSKDVQDLTLIECAILASLPQSPNKYTPLKRIATSEITNIDSYDVVTRNDNWTIYYNSDIEDKVWLVLHNMIEQGHLTQEEFDELEPQIHDLVRTSLNPSMTIDSSEVITSYFTDYVVDQVLSDLQTQLGYTEEEAHDLLYKGGLTINSTLNLTIQKHVENQFLQDYNFPDAGNLDTWYWRGDITRYDEAGNMMSPTQWEIAFYYKYNMFSSVWNE